MCCECMQMIFNVKKQHAEQVLCYEPASATYVPLDERRPLDAKLLTLFLPSPVALEVHLPILPRLILFSSLRLGPKSNEQTFEPALIQQ